MTTTTQDRTEVAGEVVTIDRVSPAVETKKAAFVLEKFELPSVEETVIFSELKLIVKHEWLDKLWRETRSTMRLEKILQHSSQTYQSYTDQLLIEKFGYPAVAYPANTSGTSTKLKAGDATATAEKMTVDCCFPCEFPFKMFGGILHYIVLTTVDVRSQLDNDGERIRAYLLEHLHANALLANEEKDDWLYIEERHSRPFIAQQRLQRSGGDGETREMPWMSDLLDAQRLPNIFHVFIQNDSLYWDDIRWGNIISEAVLFDEVIHYNKTHQHHKLGRNETWMRKYHCDREARKTKKASDVPKFRGIKDKILINEFNFPWVHNEQTNRLEAVIDDQSPKMMFASNAYPYWFAQGIRHNLVWYLCDEEEAIERAPAFIRENLDRIQPGLSYQHWENPPELKSIPDFNHFQVLSVDMTAYWKGMDALNMVKKPYDWADFVANADIAEQHASSHKFGRSERVCRYYLQHSDENLQRFESESDVVLRQVFGYDVVISENGKLQAVKGKEKQPQSESETVDVGVRLVSNPYPFFVEQNLQHLTLFCDQRNGIPERELRRIVETQLDVKADEYLFFVDTDETKRMQKLWYAHIIVNKNNSTAK